MSDKISAGPTGPVLLFDGDCGLCNRVVRLLLRLDRRGVLHFAPLQGPAAQDFLRAHRLPTEDFSSMVFVPDWHEANAAGPAGTGQPSFLLYTDGAIAALCACGRTGLAATLRLLPRRWRDAIYRLVGHARYKIFGPWRPRPLPRPEWQGRFFS